MKSAYELAMERSGITPVKKLTEEQKKKISETEALYKSKRAEAELSLNARKPKAKNMAELEQINSDFTVELASINSKLEREKEKIRNS
ncbi:MAG: hypothetical protein WCR55_01910 [Lentisphaerota bacterium]